MDKNQASKKFITKNDIILLVSILAIGFLLLWVRHWLSDVDEFDELGRRTVYAEITSPHGTFTIYLDDERFFYTDMMPNVMFEVRDGQIAFIKADCPDQVCVNTGFLSRPSQTAACLPNGIVMFLLRIADYTDANDIDVFIR